MSQKIDIAKIRTNGGTQSRVELNEATVMEYANAMHAGDTFPAIVAFFDGSDYWLADGFHRLAAERKVGFKESNVDVREGDIDDAKIFAACSNVDHGLRRTNKDKENSVLILLNNKKCVGKSDNEISKMTGVSQPFVGKVRSSYNGYKIENRTVTRGGKTYEQDTTNIGKRSAPEPAPEPTPEDKVEEIATVAVLKQASKIKKEAFQEKTAEKIARKESVPDDLPDQTERYRLIHSTIADADVEPNSIDWIITDPPYPKEFLGVFDELGEFAERVLKPGGSLICMAGQSYLSQVAAALEKHLTYNWALSYLTPGQSTQIFQRKIMCQWKPLLWYIKGESGPVEWLNNDVFKSEANDKEHHHWGQSESGMADIIERFTYPGETICDPFVGGGTTGVVAVAKNRLFIGIDCDEKAIKTTKERLSNG